MGNIIYYLYLLTYYLRFRLGTRVPVVLPDGYPGNKLPGYGSPTGKCTGTQPAIEKNGSATAVATSGHWNYRLLTRCCESVVRTTV